MIRCLIVSFFVVLSVPVTAGPFPEPVTDSSYSPIDPAEAALGQLLFYDPILSGNRNISCATCHHPKFATSDGLSLGMGEGGIGLGMARRADPQNMPEDRIPRNSPALFNLGASEFTVLFHDGRIEVDPDRSSGFRTPLDDDMLSGFTSLLSAQTMFPVLSADEMAGHYGENDVAEAVRKGLITGEGGAWDILSRRVAEIPEYDTRFIQVYEHISEGSQITFTDISNAIAAFVAYEWRSDEAPYDAFLRDPDLTLSEDAQLGLELFYGAAGCANCHAGPFQTDHRFYATGTPQLGPGKAAPFENHTKDVGRMRVTGKEVDAYAFRTPSLRNVTRTGPWGHAGAHVDLGEFLRDHADPTASIERFSEGGGARDAVKLPEFMADDWHEMNDAEARASILSAATIRSRMDLDSSEITALLAFLGTLEDPVALSGRLGVPKQVPSGLPVDGVER